jgi:hypothetical protein
MRTVTGAPEATLPGLTEAARGATALPGPQWPSTQIWPAEQAVPQAPQFVGSWERSVQPDPHCVTLG